MKKKISIVIFANHNNGYNITKYLLSRSDEKIIKIVVYEDSKDQWWKSVKQLVIGKNIDYIIFENNEKLYQQLKNLNIDIIISASWRDKITENILKLAKIGGVNFHNSFLPKYRGSYANVWPIMFGENKTGTSLHWMSKNFDDGNIIYQKELPIQPWETAWEVWQNINRNYLRMFKKIWPKVSNWKEMSFPQKGKSSFYTVADYKKTNFIDIKGMVRIKDFINFLRAKTFGKYYNDAYFIDPKTNKKIFVSIKLKAQK